MKTAVEFYNPVLPLDVRREIPEMRSWLAAITDPPQEMHPDRLWSCHVLARAVDMVWKLAGRGWRVVDGHFDVRMQHSWLEHDDLILDVYPVASCGGPILLDKHVWRRFYTEDAHRFAERGRGFEKDAGWLVAMGVTTVVPAA